MRLANHVRGTGGGGTTDKGRQRWSEAERVREINEEMQLQVPSQASRSSWIIEREECGGGAGDQSACWPGTLC